MKATLFYQTTAGRQRLLDELGELRKKEAQLHHTRSKHRESLGGRGRADHDPEALSMDEELTHCITRMAEITKVMTECQPTTAPEPKDAKRADLNTIIVVAKYKDEDDEHGTWFRFQLVGHGEGAPKGTGSGDNPELPLISYTCPLGAAVMRKRVGNTFELNGKEHEIMKIELPGQLQAANAA